MTDRIDYGKLMHHAMRGLIRTVLDGVAAEGLPGDHHFFITFDTSHPDVQIADWLSDRYPDDMTVVMQNWFDDLRVNDDGFAVTLNFGESPERLFIPYDTIKTFVDPSVEFGLRFEGHDEDGAAQASPRAPTAIKPVPGKPAKPKPVAEAAAPKAEKGDAEVVSLDSFRK